MTRDTRNLLVQARRACRSFRANESGATAIEYALIAAGIAIVIMVSVQSLGTKLNATYSDMATKLP